MKRYFESTALLTLFLSLGLVGHASANPEDGVVSAGSATISSAGKKLDIHQGSQNVVIDWRSFNIAPDEHTQFHQPSSSATALNRIGSGNASQIMGKLTANGNVMIVNPSGVIFGKDSQVDVNGMVATTSSISNADFMAGNLKFTPGGNANAAITNQGTITAKEAGLVGLVAPQVNNSGTITAKLGKVQLASGDSFNVDLYGDGLINVAISDDVTKQVVSNSGRIDAQGGLITMTAATGAQVVNSLVNIEGELDASSVSEQGGKIVIGGDVISSVGTMDASGTTGGNVTVSGRNVMQQGKIKVDGAAGAGGTASINYTKSYKDSEASKVSATGAANGGVVKVTGTQSGSHAYVSGNYDTSSTNAKGGKVEITAKDGDLKLFGAHVKADGKTGGGEILVGGDYQGTGTTAHAKTTGVNFATTLSANATGNGDGGKVVVWSDEQTLFGGSAEAKGGTTGGNGGLIEISSKETMKIAGNAHTDASAAYGAAGQLLLDPKNIIIATGGITGGSGISSVEFIDPDPDAGKFGQYIYQMGNGNVMAFDYEDDTVATDAGAVYLYNGATGALISSLYGGSVNDQIGFETGWLMTNQLLVNGNMVLVSRQWDNGGMANAGAVTWIDRDTGLSGIVGAANSLVGTSAGDGDNMYVEALKGGNYVVSSRYWDNGGAVNAGAVTWADGTAGISGTINAGNSFIGMTAADRMGVIQQLSNGNFLILTYNWHNAGLVNAGAVTWVDGNVGITGTIDGTNSLIGTKAHDYVGPVVYEVGNSNYLVYSPEWSDGVYFEVGAMTWGSGTAGVVGPVSAANSLVGTYHFEGFGSVNVLANGNYVYTNYNWSNGGTLTDAGSVTWADGNVGVSGVISAANSLVGQYSDQMLGWGGFLELSNGNYVLSHTYWNDGVGTELGAVTWASGTSAITGYVDASNSLVGTHTNDRVGEQGVIQLANGNYVITSSGWDSGFLADVGAVTWGNGTTGTVGVINATNSVVGSTTGDGIGYNQNTFVRGITTLDNGNYVVSSPLWDNGGVVDAGAVILLDGTGPSSGTLNAGNALVGTKTEDYVGLDVMALANGNYLVKSYEWNNGGILDAGAITWGNSVSGVTGAVTTLNSLVGGTTNDRVGNYFVLNLINDKYLIVTNVWDNGAEVDVGAVTWFDGGVGVPTGLLSSTNSFVGTTSFDDIGGGYFLDLGSGRFIMGNEDWDNGGLADAGAVTWFDGNTGAGLIGEIDASNSLIGSSAGDRVGYNINIVGAGNYVVLTPEWDDGGTADVGAITWGDGTTGIVGTINDTNSILGSTAGDMLGDYGLLQMSSGGVYGVQSSLYTNGADTAAGAITFLDVNGPTSGYISSGNSFIGLNAFGGLTWGEEDLINGRYIARFEGSQRIFSITPGGGGLGSYDSFTDLASSTVTLDPTFIISVLNTGTAVTLQASNDITVTDAITANNAGGDGGVLTLQAGRSLLINADITTDNGDLYLYGNERLAAGVVNGQRDAGNAVINMGAGVTLNAGTGDVHIRLDDGAGKTNRGAGDITLRDIIADTISVVNRNAGSDIVMESGTLDASGAGNSILLSSLRNFINNAGNTAFNVAPGSNWLVYSTRADHDVLGGLMSDYTLDGCLYAGPCPALQVGNAFLYSYDPNAVVPPTDPQDVIVVPPTVLYVSQTPWSVEYGLDVPLFDIGQINFASLGADGSGFFTDWIWIEPEVKLWFDLDIDKI